MIPWKYLSLLTRQYLAQPKSRLCLTAMKFDPKTRVIEKWFGPRDQLKPIVDWALKMNADKYNIYVSWANFSKEERKLETMIGTSAFIADWDGQDPERVPGLDPTLIVQTSPGRFQEVFVHEPLGREDADARYKALARRLGCDIGPSGDPVHLWRVPGTTNWPNPKKRREPSPSTWDGKVGSKVDMPQVAAEVKGGHEWPARRAGKPLTRWAKAALHREYEAGERSESFHKVVLQIAKLGWGIEDIADMMKGTAFAEKYGRRLAAEIERSIGKSELEPEEELPALTPKWFDPRDEERTIEFLWFPYLPKGEVTLLDGDGGIGKTSLMLKVTQAVIEGGEMPNGERIRSGHKVLYVSIEADYSGVTLPVLKRLGVTHKQAFAHIEEADLVLDEQGLQRLEELVERYRFDLIVIDSIVDYLDDDFEMNDYKQSSKLVLALRARLALQFNVAVVAMRHNTKGQKEKLGQRGMGSMGWAKGSRSQLVVREDPEIDRQYVIAHTKHNLSVKGPSIVYQFQEINKRGIVEWVGLSDLGDDELNEKKPDADRKSKLQECCEWLKGLLSGKGPVESSWVFEQGEARSFNRRLVQRAAGELHIQRHVDREGRGTISRWSMDEA